MLHLEDEVGMRKVVLITKDRVIELWGEEVYVTWGRKRQIWASISSCKVGEMSSCLKT